MAVVPAMFAYLGMWSDVSGYAVSFVGFGVVNLGRGGGLVEKE